MPLGATSQTICILGEVKLHRWSYLCKMRKFSLKMMNFLRKKDAFPRLKILILADLPGWAVERNTDQIIKGVPCEFTKAYYTKITSEELLALSKEHDLIHYGNTDLGYHFSIFDKLTTPMLLSIRSHRYLDYVPNLHEVIQKYQFPLHVISEALAEEFPGATVIPNGIQPYFKPCKKFVVGFSGQPTEYKGFHLIKQACEELGVAFKPAPGNVSIKKMPKYYKSIDVLVSASINEGQCNPVYEAMLMNVPVISTMTDGTRHLNITRIERSVEGIKEGILKYYTYPQVKDVTWENSNKKMLALYYDILINKAEKNNDTKYADSLKTHKEYFLTRYFSTP